MESTAPAARRRILLVDDNERLARIIALQLRLSGAWFVVGAARTPSEALSLAATEHPDLVLLDLWLGGADTLGLIPELCRLAPPPTVVVLTAEPGRSWHERALAAGAAAYLSKIEVLDIPAALARF